MSNKHKFTIDELGLSNYPCPKCKRNTVIRTLPLVDGPNGQKIIAPEMRCLAKGCSYRKPQGDYERRTKVRVDF